MTKKGEKEPREPMSLIQALAFGSLALSTLAGQLPSKLLGFHKDLRDAQILLSGLREELKMSSDLNFFRGSSSRTKATVLPDSAKAQLDQQLSQLAAGLGALKDRLASIESRLTKLEQGTVEEKSKKNGHIRSFQQDIAKHSRQVTTK